MRVYPDIESLRLHARRRIPKAVFEYVDGGSYTEATLRQNRRGLEDIDLVQRVLRDVSDRSQAVELLGHKLPSPLILGPTGLTGFVHPNGEIEALRAANAAGIPYTLCTPSICSVGDLKEAVGTPFWFQIYVMKDKDFTRYLLENAKAAGATVLVITVDVVVNAQRHRDLRNGLAIPLRMTLPTLLDLATKPGWLLRMTQSKRKTFGNYQGYLKEGTGTQSMAAWVAEQYQPLLTPETLGWIRDFWQGPVIIKGVMTPEDAEIAVEFGADGIVVSNHGGRQLDGASSTAAALPAIARAVKGETTILVDSGIRTGADIFRMLALGADACLTGRAQLYGLGAAGRAGVSRAIEILQAELDVAMALTGCRTLEDIGPHCIRHRGQAARKTGSGA